MWANNHRAVKLSRNDYPGIIRMVKEQAENYLYQPVPLPKSRVIIRMMDGTWAMHRAIARVSLSPDEELEKYRGYFLVRNLLTGKEKILPLESGFAWEAIHSIMDVEKLKSMRDRMQDPENKFNKYPTAEMTTPSEEELEKLYNMDTQLVSPVGNLDDEIEQFLTEYYPNFWDNPEEIFAGVLPGPVMHSPPPTKNAVDNQEKRRDPDSLKEPLQDLITITPSLRRQLPRNVKGFAPTRFDEYAVNYPGSRLLQQQRSEIPDPAHQEEEITEDPIYNQFSTDSDMKDRVPTPAELSGTVKVTRVIPEEDSSRPGSILSNASTELIVTRETPAPIFDLDERGLNEDKLLKTIKAPISASHFLSKFLRKTDEKDPRFIPLHTFRNQVQSTYTSARNMKFITLKAEEQTRPASVLYFQAQKLRDHVSKMDAATEKLQNWIIDPPEELRSNENREVLDFLEIFVDIENGHYLEYRSIINAVIIDGIKKLITLDGGAKLAQDLVRDSDFEKLIRSLQDHSLDHGTVTSHLDEAIRKGLEKPQCGPEPNRGAPAHIPLSQPNTYQTNDTLIQNKLFSQDQKTIAVTLGHVITSTINRIESTIPSQEKRVLFMKPTNSFVHKTPIMSTVQSTNTFLTPPSGGARTTSLIAPGSIAPAPGGGREPSNQLTQTAGTTGKYPVMRQSAEYQFGDEQLQQQQLQQQLLQQQQLQQQQLQQGNRLLTDFPDRSLNQDFPRNPSNNFGRNDFTPKLKTPDATDCNPMLFNHHLPSINLFSCNEGNPNIMSQDDVFSRPNISLIGSNMKDCNNGSSKQGAMSMWTSNTQAMDSGISGPNTDSNSTLPTINLMDIENRLIRRQIKIIVDSTICLEKNVQLLKEHALTLNRPNTHTDTQLRELNSNHDSLQEKVTRLYKDHLPEIESSINTEHILEQINTTHDNIQVKLFAMQKNCSTAVVTPSINANQLNKIKLPEIHVSRWRSPGFYKVIELIQKHILECPYEGSYYPKIILSNLKHTEPTVYNSLIAGTPPETVDQIFKILAIHTQPPKKVEILSIKVLQNNGRLSNPTATINLHESLEQEIKKSTVLQSILDNVYAMFRYYRHMYPDNSSFLTWIMSGCYSSDFCSALLQSMPAEEQMFLNRSTMQLDFKSQLEYFYNWNLRRLSEMYTMNNNCNKNIYETSNTKPRKIIQEETLEKEDPKDQDRGTTRKLRGRSITTLGAQTEEDAKPPTGSNGLGKFNVKITIRKFNNEQLRSFATFLKNDKIPAFILKDEDQNVPYQLDFSGSHSLIKNTNLTEEQKRFIIKQTGSRKGCLVCITLVEKFGMQYKLLPHLHLYSKKENYLMPTVRSNRCPNLLRMDIDSRIKLIKEIQNICQMCLGPKLNGGCNRCTTQDDSYKPNHCKTSKMNSLLCKCTNCKPLVDRFRELYARELSESKDPIIKKIDLKEENQKLLPLVPALMMSNSITTNNLPTEQDTSQNCSKTDKIIEQLEEKKIFCDQLSQNLPAPNIPAFLKDLEAADSLIPNVPVLLQNVKFDQILSTKKVLPPASERIYYKLFIKGANGQIVPSVYDTGAKSSIFVSDILKDQTIFPNKEVNLNATMQVVGGTKSEAKFHQVLLPLKSEFQYQLVQAVSLPRIVDPTPNLDLSTFMSEAWENYLEMCISEGKTPVNKSDWPSGTEIGGPVSCLVGIGELQFEILYSYKGITFITHNLDTENPIAYGGSLRIISKNTEVDQTILMAKDISCDLIDPSIPIVNPKVPLLVQDEFHPVDVSPDVETPPNNRSTKTLTHKNWMHNNINQFLTGKRVIARKLTNATSYISCSILTKLGWQTAKKEHHTEDIEMSNIPYTSEEPTHITTPVTTKELPSPVTDTTITINETSPTAQPTIESITDENSITPDTLDIQDGRPENGWPVTAPSLKYIEEKKAITTPLPQNILNGRLNNPSPDPQYEALHCMSKKSSEESDVISHVSSFSDGILKMINYPPTATPCSTVEKKNSCEVTPPTEKWIISANNSDISRERLDEFWRTEFPSDSDASSPELITSTPSPPPRPNPSDSNLPVSNKAQKGEKEKPSKKPMENPTISDFDSDCEEQIETTHSWLNKLPHTSPILSPESGKHDQLPMGSPIISPPSSPSTKLLNTPTPPPAPEISLSHLLTSDTEDIEGAIISTKKSYSSALWGDKEIGSKPLNSKLHPKKRKNRIPDELENKKPRLNPELSTIRRKLNYEKEIKTDTLDGEYFEYPTNYKEEPVVKTPENFPPGHEYNPMGEAHYLTEEIPVSPPRCNEILRADIKLIEDDLDIKPQIEMLPSINQTFNWVPYPIDLSKTRGQEIDESEKKKPRGGARKTYSEAIKKTCTEYTPSNASEKTQCKAFFNHLKIETPTTLENKSIIYTESKSNSCFFYAVGREILEDYSHSEIAKMRENLRRYLLENFKSIYDHQFSVYPTNVVCAFSKEMTISNAEAMRKYVASNDFNSHYIEETEIKPFSDLYHVTIEMTKIVYCPRKNKQIAFTRVYNEGMTTPIRILLFAEHYSSILADTDSAANRHPTEQGIISQTDFPILSKSVNTKNPIEPSPTTNMPVKNTSKQTPEKTRLPTKPEQHSRKPYNKVVTGEPHLGDAKPKTTKLDKSETTDPKPEKSIRDTKEDVKKKEIEAKRQAEMNSVTSLDIFINPTETSPELKKKSIKNPILLCNGSNINSVPEEPTSSIITEAWTPSNFSSKEQINIYLKLGGKFVSTLKSIDRILEHKNESYQPLLIGQFFIQSDVNQVIKNFKSIFEEGTNNFGVSNFQINAKFENDRLTIKIIFNSLTRILQDFFKSPLLYNSKVNPDATFVFENKKLKAYLDQIKRDINSCNAGFITEISLTSETHHFSVNIPPSYGCNLSFRPMINPQVPGLIPKVELQGEVAEPCHINGHLFVLDHHSAKYILLRSESDQRFFAKVNKLGDEIHLTDLIKHEYPEKFSFPEILTSNNCFICEKKCKSKSFLSEHLALEHQILNIFKFPETNDKSVKCNNDNCSMPGVEYLEKMDLYFAYHTFIFCPGSKLQNFLRDLKIYKIPAEFFFTHTPGKKIHHFFEEDMLRPCFSEIVDQHEGEQYTEIFHYEADSEGEDDTDPIKENLPEDNHPYSSAPVMLESEEKNLEPSHQESLNSIECLWNEINNILICKSDPDQSKSDQCGNQSDITNQSTPQVLLFNKPKMLRKQNNKKIIQSEEFKDTVRKKNISELIDSLLMPIRDHNFRCGVCSKCINCSPLENLDRLQRLNILKGRENSTIMENINIIDDPNNPGKLRICVKLPSDENSPGGPTQKEQVIREFNRKMTTLDPDSKASLQREIDKYIELGYVVPFDALPPDTQTKILSQSVRYVSSVAAFKNSQSTPSRLCLNFSSPDNITRKSENSSSLGGKLDIDIAKTARFFKAYRATAVGDVRKYYNNFLLQTADIAKQFFCWRKDLSIHEPIIFYLFTRLTFGHVAAGPLADGGMLKIISFGEQHCSFCKGRYSRSEPNKSTGDVCWGVSHLLAKIFSKTYIDDFFFAHHSHTALHQLVNYTVALFNLFSIQFKGIHYSLEDFQSDVETLNDQGQMLTLGYIYSPSLDILKIKPVHLHNGKKVRGKVMPTRNQKNELIPLKSIILSRREDITFEKINEIYSDTKKTLRVVVHLASSLYDPLGFVTPLVSQIRHTVSLAMKQCLGEWDTSVSPELWDFLIIQVTELFRTVLFDFRRFPENAVSRPGNAILVITVDASFSLIITAHLVYFSPDFKESWINLLTNKSYLASNLSSIPNREMHVQSLGAQLALKIVIEIGDLIRQAYLFNDSRVAIAWCNNMSSKPLNLFVANRVAIVKNALQTVQETLYDTHVTEDIQSPIRQSCWKNDFFKDILHWCSSELTVADHGTKYRRFNNPDSGSLITTDQVNPNSRSIQGMPWMKKIDEEIKKGNLISARALGTSLINASEADTKIYESGFKKDKAEKIQNHGHVILDNKLLPTSTISDNQQTATLLFSDASDLYLEEVIPETEESCLIGDILDDATTINLLGVAASGQDIPNELVKYVRKMKEIHETPCLIQIPSTPDQTDTQSIQIQHVLSPEKAMKSKFSLSLRIMFLVILASIKWKRAINQNLVLCRFKTDLTSGLLRPSKLESLLPMFAEKPSNKETSHDWRKNLSPLLAFSGQGPAWQNICRAWDTCSNKSVLETKQDLCLTNRDGDNRLSILYRKNLPSFIRRHPKMKFVIRKFSLIFNLIQITNLSDRTKSLQRITSALIVMERLQSDFFVGGKGNSYLSHFILKDLTECYKYLIGTQNLRSLFKEVLKNRNQWMPVDLLGKSLQFNPSAGIFDQEIDKYTAISRNTPHDISIIDCVQTDLNFTASFRCLSVFLSYILSHELKLTFPSSFIQKITIQNANLPGIYFLRSRFHNFRNDLSSHDKTYRDFLLSQGVNPCPLVMSPFSSLAYSFANEVHQTVPSLPRQSTLGSHIGYTRIYLELESVVRILQLKKLVKYIRKSCLQCKKQLQQTLPDHPGKTPEHRILKMNSFNSGIMIDLLPSIKIRTTTNQKSTRNATVLNCHILLGVDVATKFSSFVIINS